MTESGHTTKLQEKLLAIDNPDQRAALIDHTCDQLRKLASKMLGGYPVVRRWNDTDDVLQNSLLRLHRALEDVLPESPKHFYRLAGLQIRRELIDLARKFQGAEGVAANHHTDTGGIVNRTSSPTAEPDTLDEWERFHERIEQMPDNQREVTELLWYEGVSQTQASELLGVSLATVKRRWQAARLALFESLSEDDFISE